MSFQFDGYFPTSLCTPIDPDGSLVGPGTSFPVGFSIEKAVELYWKWTQLEIACTASGDKEIVVGVDGTGAPIAGSLTASGDVDDFIPLQTVNEVWIGAGNPTMASMVCGSLHTDGLVNDGSGVSNWPAYLPNPPGPGDRQGTATLEVTAILWDSTPRMRRFGSLWYPRMVVTVVLEGVDPANPGSSATWTASSFYDTGTATQTFSGDVFGSEIVFGYQGSAVVPSFPIDTMELSFTAAPSTPRS